MAVNQKVITTCDWPAHDGLHTEDESITTVNFGLDGDQLEIDLCDGQATELRDLLADYATHARRNVEPKVTAPTASAAPRGQAAKKAREKREYLRQVRDWANEQRNADGSGKFSVSDRGQVAREIRDAYDMAMAGRHQPEQQSEQQSEQSDYYSSDPRVPAFSGVS